MDDEEQSTPDFERPPEWNYSPSGNDGPQSNANMNPGPSFGGSGNKDESANNLNPAQRAFANKNSNSMQRQGSSGDSSKYGGNSINKNVKNMKNAGELAANAAAGNAVGAAKKGLELAKDNPELVKKLIKKEVGRRIGVPLAIVGSVVLLIIMVFMSVGGPSGPLDTYTAQSSAWSANIGIRSVLVRRSLLDQTRLFTDPKCTDEPVYCRLTNGISENEVKTIRSQMGLALSDSDVVKSTNSSGEESYYLKRIAFAGSDGQPEYADGSNYGEKLRTNNNLLAPMSRITSSASIFWRSPRAVDRFHLYNAMRTNPYDENATTQDPLIKTMRDYIYRGSNDYMATGTTSLDTVIDSAAEAMQSKLGESGPPATIIANTSLMDKTETMSGVNTQIDADATKKAALAVYDGLDTKEKVCAFVNAFDANNYNMKSTKTQQLIRYAGHFLTMADAKKTGAVTSQQVDVVSSITTRKSTVEDSIGKTADLAEGRILISQAKVDLPAGLGGFARFSTGGNPNLLYINNIVGKLNDNSDISSSMRLFSTQDLLNAGGDCTKLPQPNSQQLTYMRLVMGEYLVPQFVLNKAGAQAPDPLNDPEAGYGVGNALSAGTGALASGIGRGIGLEALKQGELSEAVTAANLMATTPTTTKDNNSIGADSYRNDLCNDRTITGYHLATDMFCNIQWGWLDSVLLDPSYAPRKVVNYLRTNQDYPVGSPCYQDTDQDGINDVDPSSKACTDAPEEMRTKVSHIDAAGDVKTERYLDFMLWCIQDDKPIIDQKKFGENQYGIASAPYCAVKRDDIFRFFRLYVFDTNILDAEDLSGEGTLGRVSGVQLNATTTPATGGVIVPASDGSTCAPNTADYGMQQGYQNGTMVPIHTCGITDWPSNFENSQRQNIVEVNAKISGPAAQMAAALKAAASAGGWSYTASLGFRTYQQQDCIYRYYISGIRGCSDYVTRPPAASKPGFSDHQMGFSIDLPTGYKCSSPTLKQSVQANQWLNANMASYGFSRNAGCKDYGHFTNKGGG